MTDTSQNRVARFTAIKRVLWILLAIFLILVVAFSAWMFRLDRSIKTRFAEKRFAPPVEFYSAAEIVRPGSSYPPGYFETYFKRKNFRLRDFGQAILPGDFSVWSGEQCRSVLPIGEPVRCVAYQFPTPNLASTDSRNTELPSVQILALGEEGTVLATFAGENATSVESARLEPELFAQYYGENPVLRKVVTLGETPTLCLNALLAIEDSNFLEHSGVSVTGLARAVWTNLRSGRRAQGGSTITQQLVKNYFLTEEKTLRRKLTELAMAVLVERHATKDDILETYINLIYMGQNGPFQVRGFAAASQHYFGKPLSDLGLDQCAMLTAVLNSPGLYNPFTSPERAIKRRAKVLDRMQELQMIDEAQAKIAKEAPLPNKPQRALTEPAPYFVQAVRREIVARGLEEDEGLRIYTTLNLRAQEAAHQAIRSGLDRLESKVPYIAKLKAKGKNLEALLISANPTNGHIEAMVGGRGFLATQFNRAMDSRRQVGSVMKPFVYLTAFESRDAKGEPYTPLSILQDKPTTHKFEGQTWSPRNYDGKYNGDVPLYWALKESLNASTVNLGMEVGLDNISETARRVGVTSKFSPYPSLTLGAFELSPLEVLESYGTLARLGTRSQHTIIARVDDLMGQPILTVEPKLEEVVAAESAAELVGAMKQTIESGTGRAVRALGFERPAAGKTGTTNDKKDAWFAGFTPHHVAIVWVGYDDNTSHNLTGASGAVPIWTNYMKAYANSFPPDDFPWPESVEKVILTPDQQRSFGVPDKPNAPLENDIELIFKRGTSPVPPAPQSPSNDAERFRPSGGSGL